jgi:hypothetical protein
MEQPIFSALASTRVICENGIPMPKPLSTVAQQLKEWRARNNLSQAQALTVFKEASLPVTLDSLQNWESVRNSPLAFSRCGFGGFS